MLRHEEDCGSVASRAAKPPSLFLLTRIRNTNHRYLQASIVLYCKRAQAAIIDRLSDVLVMFLLNNRRTGQAIETPLFELGQQLFHYVDWKTTMYQFSLGLRVL